MEKFGPPKKKMEKKSELTPPVESVFWTCFFLFPCVRDVSFLLEGIMAALTKLLGNYHQLDWAGKS